MEVKFDVDSFEYLKRDTVYNRILRAMLNGKKSIIIDNDVSSMTRCVDEELSMEELQDNLESLGFLVKRLYTHIGSSDHDLVPTNSYIVKWGKIVFMNKPKREEVEQEEVDKESLLEWVDKDIENFLDELSTGDIDRSYSKELVEMAEEIIDDNPEAFKSFL